MQYYDVHDYVVWCICLAVYRANPSSRWSMQSRPVYASSGHWHLRALYFTTCRPTPDESATPTLNLAYSLAKQQRESQRDRYRDVVANTLHLYTVSQKNWTLFHLSITFENTVRFY